MTTGGLVESPAELDRAVARIQEVLDVLPGSVALLVPVVEAAGETVDWQVAAISPDSNDIAGRRAGQMLGRRVLDLYPTVAGTDMWKAYAHTYETGSPSVVDLTYTEDHVGLPRESRYTMRVRRTSPGIVVSWVRRDLDERSATRLADTERMGNLGWGVWRADGSIEWSDHLYRVFDRDPTHGPMSFPEFIACIHPDDRARVQERFLGLADRDDPYDVEFRLMLAGGARHLRTRTEVTRDATGRALETFCLAQDITDLYQSRERLLRTRQELAVKDQRLADERRLALRLQRIILPVPDEPLDLPGMRVGVRYLPAGQASHVGGDWYHAMALRDGSLLLAIGDVAGHGLAAASVMAQLRHALTGLAAAGNCPAAMLGALNTIMCEHVPEHTLSTAVVARYQPDTRKLTWAQAGHLPCMLIRGTGVHLLDRPEGCVLGAHLDVEYATAQATLRPGDLLLMFTDGLVERPDLTINAGIADFAAAVSAAAGAGPAGTDRSAAVLHAVRPANFEDDACLLVAEATGPLIGPGDEATG